PRIVVYAISCMIVHPARDVKDPVGGGPDCAIAPGRGACRGRHSLHNPRRRPAIRDRTPNGQLSPLWGSAPAAQLRRGADSWVSETAGELLWHARRRPAISPFRAGDWPHV